MKNSLFLDSAIYSVGSILRRGFSFFLIPIYTRFLTVDEYGMLAILNIILQLLCFVSLMGVSSAAMRHYFDPSADLEYRKQLYGNSLILLFVLPLLILLALFPGLLFLSNTYLPTIPFFPLVFVVLLTSFFHPIRQLLIGLFRVQRKAKTFVIFTTALFVLQTGIIIVAVVGLKKGITGLVLAQLSVYIVFWIVSLAILLKYSNLKFSRKISKQILLFGIPLIPSFIFMWMNDASARFLLERFGSLRDVGIFSLAFQFSHILIVLGLAFDNAIIPYFYQTAQKTDGEKILGSFATKYFSIVSLMALFTLLVSKPMVLVMADAKYHEALLYIPLLILAGWLVLLFKIFHWSLLFSKRTGTVSVLYFFTALFTIGLLIVSLNHLKLGIFGVAFVAIFIGIFQNIAGFWLSRKRLRIKYHRNHLSLIALFIIPGAILMAFISTQASNIPHLVMSGLVFISVSLIVLKIAKIDILNSLSFLKLKKTPVS